MAKRKGDITIGQRMAEEVYRIFGSYDKASNGLRCGKNAITYWKGGGTPGGFVLAKLHYCGGDVVYVLTGKRGV